jgi:hypothetical protein
MRTKILLLLLFFAVPISAYTQEKSHFSANMGWGIIYGLQGGVEYQFNEKYALGLGGGAGLSTFSSDVVSSFRLDNNFAFGKQKNNRIFRPGCFSLSLLNMNIDEHSVSYSSIYAVPSVGVCLSPVSGLGIKMSAGVMMNVYRFNTKWKTKYKDMGFLLDYLPEVKISVLYAF